MRRKIHLSIMQFSIILAIAILTTTITVLAASGTTDAPNAPALTSSYTLEDIYQRLVNGTDGSQGTFTEPAVAPGTGSMHDLNDIMSAAPQRTLSSAPPPIRCCSAEGFGASPTANGGCKPDLCHMAAMSLEQMGN